MKPSFSDQDRVLFYISMYFRDQHFSKGGQTLSAQWKALLFAVIRATISKIKLHEKSTTYSNVEKNFTTRKKFRMKAADATP